MTINPQLSAASSTTAVQPSPEASSGISWNPEQPMPPFDSSAPNVLSDPDAYFGDDVYSKTYIALDWMKNDPNHSTNDAEMFLLFLSSVCTIAHEENSPYPYDSEAFQEYANELVAIQGPNGKSLIDECVDITMDQLVLNGQTPEEAAITIESYFPYWPPGDPITNEARSEADTYYKTMDPNPTQDDIDAEWEAFITDDSTVDSINQYEADNPPSNAIPTSTDNPTMPPYDPSAPSVLFDPDSFSGSDVLSKSYLWLDWLEKNPSNTNGAEVFLLYTSNLAAAGYFGGPDGNALSNGLLAIDNGANPPKTLVAECVDITMEQMVVSGMSTQAAEDQIDALFPGNDPVSVAVRAEADSEQKQLQTDINNGQPPTQESIDSEWYDYMTDENTVSSIESAKSDLMGAMIDGTNGNVYLALLAIMMLLEAAGINSMDAYGSLSDELADETNQLNQLITEWDDGSAYDSPQDALDWMNDLQDLQEQMDATPFDDATHDLIDEQFNNIYNQQASIMFWDGRDDLYIDDNGNIWVSTTNNQDMQVWCKYNSSNGTFVFYNNDTKPTNPQPLTIGDLAFGYTSPNGQHTYGPNGTLLQDSFEAFQAQPVDPDNPNTSGFSSQDQAIDSSLNALVSPLSQQTAAVGAEMQQTSSWIELVDNTLSATLLDDSGFAGTMSSITDNMQA